MFTAWKKTIMLQFFNVGEEKPFGKKNRITEEVAEVMRINIDT